MKRIINYFSRAELLLWLCSVLMVLLPPVFFGTADIINLSASLIGVTSLIFCAKGNPIGQVLVIIFSILYSIISYSTGYYGEMLTYAGMTAPMAVFSLISWLLNPYNGDRSQVRVGELKKKDTAMLVLLTALVTLVFYFILKALGTSSLAVSTISVTTSFSAVYLTFKRSPYYAVAYAFNDIVLIILWTVAAINDISYISVIMCFAAFLANDIYGFYNWQRMKKAQKTA